MERTRHSLLLEKPSEKTLMKFDEQVSAYLVRGLPSPRTVFSNTKPQPSKTRSRLTNAISRNMKRSSRPLLRLTTLSLSRTCLPNTRGSRPLCQTLPPKLPILPISGPRSPPKFPPAILPSRARLRAARIQLEDPPAGVSSASEETFLTPLKAAMLPSKWPILPSKSHLSVCA